MLKIESVNITKNKFIRYAGHQIQNQFIVWAVDYLFSAAGHNKDEALAKLQNEFKRHKGRWPERFNMQDSDREPSLRDTN